MRTKNQKAAKIVTQFEESLKKILGVTKFQTYDEYPDSGYLTLEYQDYSGGLTFDQLSQVSELLGTKKINLGSRVSHWAYSEYTYGDDVYVRLDCSEVKYGEVI